MIITPNQEQHQWKQANQSDLFGNVHITKGITFDTEGYLRLSYSSRGLIDEVINSDFDNPAVIIESSPYDYFVGTWDDAFRANSKIFSVRPTKITDANVPATAIQSDAVWFGAFMPTTESNGLRYLATGGGGWTDTNVSLTSDGQHKLANFVSLAALAVADINTVKLYAAPLTATPTLITTLTIGAEFEITSICYFNQNLYIATQNIHGSHAFLYVWNGLGTAANSAYEVDSNIIFDVCAHKNSVMLTTGNGSLLRFNGGGFELADAFPIFYIDQSISDANNIQNYHNIMKSNGNLLYILLSNSGNDSNRLLSQPDGVWCYDENVGLYHRYPLSNSMVSMQTSNTVDTTTNIITVTTAPITGTEMVFVQSFGLTPLVDGTKYFVIKVSATEIKLATTLENALAGTAIDLLVNSGSNIYVFYPDIDFGQYFINRTMALYVIERPIAQPILGTDILWGAEVPDRGNSDQGSMGAAANGISARGYFISPKHFSTDVTDTSNQVTVKFSPFTSELDKIIIKYRNEDDMRQFIKVSDWAIVWTSTTTFTTTYAGWANAIVGDEVEVLKGAAGGLLAHISAISEAGGTYTVTIDEEYKNFTASDDSTAVFRNWKKWKTIAYGDSDAEKHFISKQLGKSGKFLQLKIELRGVNVRIEEVLIDNVPQLPAKGK